MRHGLLESLPGEIKVMPVRVEIAPESPAAVPPESPADTPETASADDEAVSRFADLKFGEDYDIAEDAAADGESKGRFKRKK